MELRAFDQRGKAERSLAAEIAAAELAPAVNAYHPRAD